MLTPLKTLKGSRIWYAKGGIGKKVGDKIYLHKDYALDVVPTDVWWDAQDILHKYEPGATFNCICYDLKRPSVVRFDACVDFDIEDCPVVGWQYTVDTYSRTLKKKYCSQLFHHKWLWCKEDYTGFDMQASYEYSKRWTNKFEEVASGYPDKWEEQLKKYGLK